MFSCAHRVSDATGRVGVNAYRHLHGAGFPWPAEPWKIPESSPGELVADRIAVPPDGAQVHAYLDVVAPDDVSGAEVDIALTGLWLALAADETGPVSSAPLPNPVVYRQGRVVVRYAAESGLPRAAGFSELRSFVDPSTATWNEVQRRVAG